MARDKKRLPSAKKYITGNEAKAFDKVFHLLSASSDGKIELDEYEIKFVYCEVKVPGKFELDVFEDEPDELEGLYSMSFDLFDSNHSEMGEIIFYRDAVHLTGMFHEDRIVERLLMAVLRV